MNLDAEDPYEILGTTPDATETEVKVAAAKAKRELNPDHFPEGEKTDARRRLYRVREAEQAILEDRPMDQTVGQPAGSDGREAGETETGDAEQSRESKTPRTVELSVEVTPETVTAGSTVSFQVVEDDGEPVRDAEISVAGQTLTTDGNGVASTTLDEPGTVRVRATKTGSAVRYDTATATVRVRPHGDGIDLAVLDDVETDRSGRLRVEAGASVTVETLDSETGRAVSGATVEVESAGQTDTGSGDRRPADLTTDSDGRATVTFTEPGRVTVRATDGRTESDELEVVVRRGDADRGAEWEAGDGAGGVAGSAGRRLAARAVGLLSLVGLSGLIGLVVVSETLPILVVASGGGAVAVGLLVYLWLVAR